MEPNPSHYGLLSSQRMSKVKDWKGMSNDTGVIRMNEVDQFTWYPFLWQMGAQKKYFSAVASCCVQKLPHIPKSVIWVRCIKCQFWHSINSSALPSSFDGRYLHSHFGSRLITARAYPGHIHHGFVSAQHPFVRRRSGGDLPRESLGFLHRAHRRHSRRIRQGKRGRGKNCHLNATFFLALGCRWSFKLATVAWLRCLYFLCCRLCWLCCQVLILRSIQMADKNGCIYSIVTAFPWSWAAAYHRHISTIFTHRSIMFYPFQSIDRLWVKYG